MKKLKEKIEKILKKLQSGYFKDYPAVGSEIQITSEELEVLFKQQMKGLVGEQESERWGAKGSIIKTESIARNILREKLLKNIESL